MKFTCDCEKLREFATSVGNLLLSSRFMTPPHRINKITQITYVSSNSHIRELFQLGNKNAFASMYQLRSDMELGKPPLTRITDQRRPDQQQMAQRRPDHVGTC
jgi:hypothetical protein